MYQNLGKVNLNGDCFVEKSPVDLDHMLNPCRRKSGQEEIPGRFRQKNENNQMLIPRLGVNYSVGVLMTALQSE